ncbi:hypothetical protein JG687_00016042 [Phytophthora cactorum]|uniref:Uncharacterized protein n=1 Tax=Phytophthora cactorum TaxID=29920 RepID=A0A8T1TRQ4_9STRA|nr:hypothetical protein JG687_00016042 [Phytophthora cactorum]
MAAAAAKEVNQQRDKNEINYARNAMMPCGCHKVSMGLSVLSSYFLEIVRKYPEEFEGKTKDEDITISDDSENTLSEDNAIEQNRSRHRHERRR